MIWLLEQMLGVKLSNGLFKTMSLYKFGGLECLK